MPCKKERRPRLNVEFHLFLRLLGRVIFCFGTCGNVGPDVRSLLGKAGTFCTKLLLAAGTALSGMLESGGPPGRACDK